MAIRFYKPDEPYGCFSNFSPHPVKLAGKLWPTSEHYFQAQKFAGTGHEEEVRKAKSPMVAARLGRSRARPLRKDWEAVKDDVMRVAVEAKVRQHADVREALLSTGAEELVEAAEKDSYWGCGADGKGRNQLGKTLMQVREKLRAEAAAAP